MTILLSIPNSTGQETLSVPVIRSRRRTISIQICPDLSVSVRAPKGIPEAEIRAFVRSRLPWIVRTRRKLARDAGSLSGIPPLTPEELLALTARARRDFPPRIALFAAQIGVSFGRITIRHQKTRWGSCSAKGNLNFNCLLLLTPEKIQDYVIVHELCHRKEMNHSRAFWSEVERVLPDYRDSRTWLREHGPGLVRRLPESG